MDNFHGNLAIFSKSFRILSNFSRKLWQNIENLRNMHVYAVLEIFLAARSQFNGRIQFLIPFLETLSFFPIIFKFYRSFP